jgi:hypothetical protein
VAVTLAVATVPAFAHTDDRTAPALASGTPRSDGAARAAQLEQLAEAAIRRNDLTSAEKALAESLQLPENIHTARARELSAVIHEKTGDVEGARRIYEDYLARYRDGVDAERVTQRLASLDTAEPTVLRETSLGSASEWRVDARGAFSQWYLQDHSRSDFYDANDSLTKATDRRINVDELLSTADLTLTASGEATRIELRASAAYVLEHRPVVLVGADRQKGSYTMLYDRSLEVANEDIGLSARFGRQPRFRDGIFGRFDGSLLGWQATPRLKFNVFSGHPVTSSRDITTDDERTFRGSSLEYASESGGIYASVHLLDQDALEEVDRRSVGAQVRIVRGNALVDGLIDYDRYFERLNAARLAFNYGFENGSTLSLIGQRVHYPLLAVTNSIIGQPNPTIDAVRALFDQDTLERLARDRTLESRETTLTYSVRVSDKLELVADATLAHTTASPPSGNVPAFESLGNERFFGVQLIRTGLLGSDDVWIAGLRVARNRLSDVHVLDLMGSFRVTSRFSIVPRLQLRDVDQSSNPGATRKITPSVRFLYDVSRRAQIEADIGGNAIRQMYAEPTIVGRRQEKAFVAYVGYRLLF